MELRQLAYLTALYEEGSVTKAARRLNVVQPAVSQQIQKLEDELQQPLFQRTPKGMIPTPAGEDAYRHFLPILRNLETAKLELTSGKGEIKGHVSVGVIASVASHALSETLISFAAKYPQVTIWSTGGYTVDLLEMLRTGKLDIAIINQARRKSPIPAIPILEENMEMVFSANNPAEFGSRITLSNLARQDLVLTSTRHGLRGVIDDITAAYGTHLQPRHEIDEINTIEDFIENSNFVTILPKIAVHRTLATGRLKSVPIKPPISRSIVCAVNRTRPLAKAAELFINELRDNMLEAIAALPPTSAKRNA